MSRRSVQYALYSNRSRRFSEVRLVLLRHGNTEWNVIGRFTGWTDIPLIKEGLIQAAKAGERLAAAGLIFDAVHISVLRRTHETAESLLAAMQHAPIPMHATWRLNERHYGQLQGMNKQEIFDAWGEHNYRRWWRGYYEAPPALELDDPRHPRFDPRYATLAPEQLPRSESLSDCQHRLLPWWFDTAAPQLATGHNLLVVSHGNTIRSLVMHLENIAPDAIEHVEIPSGKPLLYRFNEKLEITGKEWLE
jgi:2,3-bisphosphoglycerate-dependent phosphoglycerate mutase